MRHLQFWFARTSISGEVLMKVGKEALNSRQEDCYRQPRHGLQQDFNQHNINEDHDALALSSSMNCSVNGWANWWLSSLCWIYWRFLRYCSVCLKASGVVWVWEKCQSESDFHAFTAYSKHCNFTWCFPRCFLFQSWSIYFCYLLHYKLPENRLSPLLNACRVPAAIWLSFLLGLQVLLRLMWGWKIWITSL